MYNNFSSKKTKKVISALLASALVVTSGPITADAATAKVVGIKKTFTVSASATNKVTGLSKAEKKVVKVTKKGKKFTIKGLKAGKATFKIGKKSYTVKVGATTVKAAKTKLTLTKGKAATLKFTTKSGNGDTLTFKASNKNVTLAKKSAKIAKSAASVKATAKKAGKTTITATSKATGKKATVTVTVKAATTPATATPGTSNTPSVTTGAATNTPEATATATATASGSATNTPDVTATPVATATGTATATPVVTGSATNTPEATEVPTEAPTKAPEVVTGGTITVTTNVTGASIKVISGTAVIAETATTATTAAIKNIANGTYTVVVSANGCNDETKLVTVKGDVAVDFVLSAKTLNVTGVTAEDTQGKALSLDKVTKNGVIKVAFDSAVDKDTVNSATFKITDAAGTPIGIPSTDIKLDASGKTVSVSFDNTSLEKKKSYTLTVANVKSTDGLTVKESKTAFTVADVAVVNGINSYTSYIGDGNGSGATVGAANLVESKNAGAGATVIVISYDEAVDSATTIASNITLLDVAKNEKRAIKDIKKDSKKVILTFDSALTTGKQYTLTTNNIKTSTGSDVEDYKLTFAVAGQLPTNGGVTVTTLDNIKLVNGDKAWPLLTAGTHETNATSTYYAGIQLKVQFKEKLDKTSAEKYIKLVDAKEDTFVDATVVYDEASKMATITPAKDLKEGAAYRVVVLGGLKTVQGIYMDYDKQDTEKVTLQSFTTLEITSPTIVNVESTDGLTNLNPKEDHIFTVTFSKPVADLTDGYLTKVLFVKSNTEVEKYYTESDNYGVGNVDIAPVPGTDGKSYTIKIKAGTKALDYDGAYKLIIVGEDLYEDAGIAKNAVNHDLSNNTLKASTNVVFTTAALDKTGPVVSKVYSGDKIDSANEITSTKTNVIAGDSMVFEFNEELKAGDKASNIGGRRNNTILLENYDGKTGAWNKVPHGISAIAYVANSNSKDVAVRVTFSSELDAADGKYRVVFKENSVYDNADTKGDQSADGYNGLEKEFKFEFIGSDNQDTNVDIKAGTINDSNAMDVQGSGELSSKAKFVVAFQETDITNVTTDNIVVQDADGNKVSGKIAEKAITGTGSSYTKMYVFTPDDELKTSTVYTITVDGVKDVAGNAIAKKVVQLKTAGADVKVGDISIANNATSVDRQKTITIALTDKADSVNASSYTKTTDNGKTNVVVTLTKSAGGDATGRANVALSDDGKSVKLTFGNADGKKLDPNTAYTLTVKTQKGDDTANGNNGEYVDIADSTKTIKFTTGVVATDDVKPTVISATLDSNGLTAGEKAEINHATGSLVLKFSEGVNKDDLKVEITNMSNSTSSVDVLSSALSKDDVANDTLTVTTVGMKTADTYKIVVSGVKDAAGNVMDSVTYYVAPTPTPEP